MTVVLRAARPLDAGATGEILWRYLRETGWMPNLYSGAQTIAFCGKMIDRGWVTVAEADGRIVGFLARDGQEICALYLNRAVWGKGIARLLLDDAKSQARALRLRSFEANARANRFYRRAGFVEVARCDGRDNAENLPDITYVWPKEAAR
ncbi:GNAT family N-acetyltransferase [Sedimentitalea nanhaiensis]|uniref:Ribosomal protein S18 acetylase RimI n=1 Tax=Sedimentitalea nanhaiensis TaxID=999627 RepID=A0A1I7CE72_9RHOB|nr:GNAT family N-acetyltransferase [Sedimentitalea nanhaiensis]SFT97739.1 Ribosomal protein S18 acetylase RimI [Sedimentitalea nanhaiensis]